MQHGLKSEQVLKLRSRSPAHCI